MRPEKAEAAQASSGERLAEQAGRPPDGVPRLVAGIELIGEYKESGYKEPPTSLGAPTARRFSCPASSTSCAHVEFILEIADPNKEVEVEAPEDAQPLPSLRAAPRRAAKGAFPG